jgi:hypothetical protein
MKEFNPGVLRTYADSLEDPRRMENVENCLYYPQYNQHLLLALNSATSKTFTKSDHLPRGNEIISALKEHVISVSTLDGQTARLGFFLTNAQPFSKMFPNFTAGIFPVTGEITEYLIRPHVYAGAWQKTGTITINDQSATGDPFIINDFLTPPSLLFFKKSPFGPDEPYKTELPDGSYPQPMYLEDSEIAVDSLEKNVIDRALWYAKNRKQKPLLFTQRGFHEFIKKNHSSDDRYFELYKYYHARFVNPVSSDAR